jgi:hypothetical protein
MPRINKEQLTLYESRDAESWSNRNVRFRIVTSNENRSIDPLIWVKWTFKFTNTRDISRYYTENNPGDALNAMGIPADDKYMATRHCWCVQRAMENISVKVNDRNVISHCPRDYTDALSRIYIDARKACVESSGGAFDCGSMDTNTPSDVSIPREMTDEIWVVSVGDIGSANMYSADLPVDYDDVKRGDTEIHKLPSDSTLTNHGLQKRIVETFKRLQSRDTNIAVNGAAQSNMAPTNANTTLVLYEPLPVEPFALFPKFMSGRGLDFAKKMDININLASNMADLILNYRAGNSGVANTDVVPVLELASAPKILVRYVPNTGIERPLVLPVHYMVCKSFDVDRTSNNIYVEGTNKFKFDIHNDSKKLYFYLRRATYSGTYPTEHFLGIERLVVITRTARHDLDVRQLYDQYTRESVNKDLDFENYRKTKTVAILDKDELDIGQRVELHATWRNYWKIPRIYAKESVAIDDGVVGYQACLIVGNNVEFHS